MKVVTLNTKDPLKISEGCILKYLGGDYRFDYQDYAHVFQLIGGPIQADMPTVQWNNESSN